MELNPKLTSPRYQTVLEYLGKRKVFNHAWEEINFSLQEFFSVAAFQVIAKFLSEQSVCCAVFGDVEFCGPVS